MRRLNELDLSARDLAIIRRAAEVLRAHANVGEVILYGSKARGDDRPESDIDLLAITNRPLPNDSKSQLRERLTEVEGEYDFDVCISPLYVSRDEWNGPWLAMPLRQNVLRDGVAL